MEELMIEELTFQERLSCPYTHHSGTHLVSDEDFIYQGLDSREESHTFWSFRRYYFKHHSPVHFSSPGY